MIARRANGQEDCSLYARHCLQTERQWWPMEADTYCLQGPLPRQRRSASAGLRWCGALVRRDPERIRYDQDQRPAKRKAAVGSEEPIEGKETKARCPFQYGQVQAGGSACAVEPAEWRQAHSVRGFLAGVVRKK